ncbi:hypothetical protein [Sanguibacter sp. 25GB23B1]|uniref:hypothetical protein n=1 Tax=unclassified Sanguibacter TaxID=2645534 RepID=UPI0032AFD4F9
MHGLSARIRAARAANHPTPERRLELERELWLHLEKEGATTSHRIPTVVLVRIL